jgi:hypothetical protein
VSKSVVSNFLDQLNTHIRDIDAVRHADMYFATWMNAIPYQLSTDLVELTNEFSYSLSSRDGIARNKRHIMAAAQTMWEKMSENPTVFPPAPGPAWEDRDVRSPCSTDKCLFLCSAPAFPHPCNTNFSVNSTLDDVESLRKVALGEVGLKKWKSHPYHHAVDGRRDTYYELPHGRFYIGLLLLERRYAGAVLLEIGSFHPLEEIHKYQTEVYTDTLWKKTNVTWSVELGRLVGLLCREVDGIRLTCTQHWCPFLRIVELSLSEDYCPAHFS